MRASRVVARDVLVGQQKVPSGDNAEEPSAPSDVVLAEADAAALDVVAVVAPSASVVAASAEASDVAVGDTSVDAVKA